MPLTNIDQLLAQAQMRGMATTQTRVTKSWLVQNQARFDRLEFEVHVGQGATPLPEWPDATRDQFRYQTQKRIDVVAWTGEHAVLVEVKRQANVGAIGQLLAYRLLWMAMYPDAGDPGMVIVCETADNDVISSAHAHGIDVEIYRDPNA